MVRINKISIISIMTLKEILKSKILYQIFFLAFLIGAVSYISSRFTFGIPAKVGLDIGLGLISLSSIGMSLFFGISLIAKEIESRTLYLILSRPISRNEFLLGKLFGLGLIIFLNWLLLTFVLSLILLILKFHFTWFYFASLCFIFFESILVLLIMVALSLVANPVISLLGSTVLLITGHLIGDVFTMNFVQNNVLFLKIITIFQWIFPHYYKLNFKNYLLYHQDIEPVILIYAFFYWLCYAGFVLLLSLMFFRKKSLD